MGRLHNPQRHRPPSPADFKGTSVFMGFLADKVNRLISQISQLPLDELGKTGCEKYVKQYSIKKCQAMQYRVVSHVHYLTILLLNLVLYPEPHIYCNQKLNFTYGKVFSWLTPIKLSKIKVTGSWSSHLTFCSVTPPSVHSNLLFSTSYFTALEHLIGPQNNISVTTCDHNLGQTIFGALEMQ